jgi:hypothetical protein
LAEGKLWEVLTPLVVIVRQSDPYFREIAQRAEAGEKDGG